ncbi:MAG: hypothetical protein KAX40_07955 [Herpetosiphon sp.]|nr:hypothetical protein [Herpetosiphon sp.]
MSNHPSDLPDDMQAEYDFSGGERGKYARAFQQGYTIRIHKKDGSIEEEYHPSSARLIELDEDVFAFFSDSTSVNRALRGLIDLIPHK